MVFICCVHGCKTKSDHGIVLRKFPPIDSPMFEQWKVATMNISLKNMSNQYIRKRKRVCNLHFAENYRKRFCFCPYDLPMLMANKAEYSSSNTDNLHLNKTDAEENINSMSAKNITIYNDIKSVNNLDHSYCRAEAVNLNIEDVAQEVVVNSKDTVDVKSKQKYIIRKDILSKRKMENRIYYLEKLNKKYKAECKEFAKFKKLNRNVQNFVKSQLCNVGKKARGEYYSLEDKALALNIYKKSRSCYKYLSSIFKLPSLTTVMSFNSKMKADSGINDNIIDALKQHINKSSSMEEKLVTLIFNEIAVTPNFDCLDRRGMLNELEDDGYKRTDTIVDHALVFIVRNIYKEWTFPVSYIFSKGSTESATIVRYVQELVTRITEMGYIIVALVCDQSPANCAAIKMLLENSQRTYIEENKNPKENIIRIGKSEIVPIYDICNLIKCMRDNLLEQNLKFILNGEVLTASWEDIKTAYFIDAPRKIRSMNKITAAHVIPEQIPKMEVSKALQVFSQTVSGMMQIMIDVNMYCPNGNQLTSDSMGTALLCNFLNKLFDSLNIGILDNKLNNCVTGESTHLKLWHEAKEVLKSMVFVNQRNEMIEQPSVIQNFVTTINGFINLHSILLNKKKLKYLPTKLFNQDPLENICSEIKQMQELNKQTRNLLKSQNSINTRDDNCETDFCAILTDDLNQYANNEPSSSNNFNTLTTLLC